MKKIILLLSLFVWYGNQCFGQCIDLYRCGYCSQTTRGSSKPNSGKGCNGNNYKEHSWSYQGVDDPECERQMAIERAAAKKAEALCEKNSVKKFKEGVVTNNYCPSGKPSQVEYSNGTIEKYFESGRLKTQTTNQGNEYSYYTEYNEDGSIVEKGASYKYSKIGEWYFEKYDTYIGYEPYKCTNCIVTFDDNGKFLHSGTKQEYEEEQRAQRLAQINRDFKNCITSSDYINHYNSYPDSKYSSQALEKGIAKHWEEINTNWESNSFLLHYTNYKNSPYVDDAKKRYNECLVWENAERTLLVESINEYRNKYPKGHFTNAISEVEEKCYFERAKKADDSYDNCSVMPNEDAAMLYKDYLKRYPAGSFAPIAKTRLFARTRIKIRGLSSVKERIRAIENFTYENPKAPCNGVFLKQIESLKILEKTIKYSNQPVYLTNLLIPGIGHVPVNKALGETNLSYYTTIAVWGLGGTGAGFWIASKSQYNKYTNSTDPAEWDGQIAKANKNLVIGEILLASAAGILVLDYINLFAKKIKLNKKIKEMKNEQNSFENKIYGHSIQIHPYFNSGLGLNLTLNF